jgi:hypothetical protein
VATLWYFQCIDTFIANPTKHSHAWEPDSDLSGQAFRWIRRFTAVFKKSYICIVSRASWIQSTLSQSLVRRQSMTRAWHVSYSVQVLQLICTVAIFHVLRILLISYALIFFVVVIFGEQHKSWRSSICNSTVSKKVVYLYPASHFIASHSGKYMYHLF